MRDAESIPQTLDIIITLSPENRDEGVFQTCIVQKTSSWYNYLRGYANHTRSAAVSLPLMLDERGCRGGPDLVVEILSPSTAKKDTTLKLTCYEEQESMSAGLFIPERRW